MKIGVIVDDLGLARWQAEALRELGLQAEFLVYNCTNSRPSPKRLRHAGYYALRLLALTTDRTRRVPLPSTLLTIETVDFASTYQGQWQALPPDLVERIRSDAPELLIKFGMGLLRVPPDVGVPILSYHHGDPRHFRGRPAGFYELLSGRLVLGQVVQRLSNRLDAGEVVAFGETRAYPYSYCKTIDEAYRCSPLLLPSAIRNALSGTTLPIDAAGKNYRLPSNLAVARFMLGRWAALARRLTYGALFEKVWRVARAPLASGGPTSLLHAFPPKNQWRIIDTPRRYRFLADPFYEPDGRGVLAEALRARSGRGEIVLISNGSVQSLSSGDEHFSYPAAVGIGEQTYVLPEISEWSRPHLYRLADDALEDLGELGVPGTPRLVDPTLFQHDGSWFLFANVASESLSVLRLWVAEAPTGAFREHPLSPIRISPAGSRMGGAIARSDGALVRIGQDLRGSYGDGALLFRIEQLSPTDYREVELGEVRLSGHRGPHTLNFRGPEMVFDFYDDRFSLFAGVRRLRGRMMPHTAPGPRILTKRG